MIRVFLVDDHAVLRQGLRVLLATQPGLQVVGEAGSGDELLALLPAGAADVVLLDVHMPGLAAADTLRHLAEAHPAVRVLALSADADLAHIQALLDAGARGYLPKTATLDEIAHGIRTVAAGRPFLSAGVGLEALHRLLALPAAGPAPPAALSKREGEVLHAIADGLNSQEIADRLFISLRTVETHRQRLLSKTQMKNTAALIRFAVGAGLVQ